MFKFTRVFAFLIILFLMLFDLGSVMALEFPSFNLFKPFPSLMPFPTTTPKPATIPGTVPSATPAPTPAPAVFGIEDVDPDSANFMEEFKIYGSKFGANPGSVNFRYYTNSYSSGGAPIVSWSDNEIVARVPAVKKGSYRIQVITSDNKKSNEVRFTVRNGQPIINSTSVQLKNGSYELTFGGTEFGYLRGTIDIYLGSDMAGQGIIKSWSSSSIRFTPPALPNHEYGFQITTADGRKSSLKFFTVGN